MFKMELKILKKIIKAHLENPYIFIAYFGILLGFYLIWGIL